MLTVLFICLAGYSSAQSPLSSYSSEWNAPEYQKCNTAASAAYMSAKEKEVIYILNLARVYPALFARTVVEAYPERSGRPELANDKYYYQSLLSLLRKMKALSPLEPCLPCYTSANCHALHAGQKGYVGHVRQSPDCKRKKHYMGECCDYGNSAPLDIVLSLLIDEGVPSLGHRSICFHDFTSVGVSIQPHRKYGTNTVFDFY